MTTIICSAQRRLSGAELELRAARAAAGLRELGLSESRTLGLLLRNDFAYFEAMRAARLAGTLGVPINWHFVAEEVRYILDDAKVAVLVVHADLLHRVADIIAPEIVLLVVETPAEIARAYDIAEEHCVVREEHTDWQDWVQRFAPLHPPVSPPGSSMLYTSGTTGRPKGVRRAALSDAKWKAYLASIAHGFGVSAGMRGLITGPLYHSAPNGYAAAGISLGCELHLMPRFAPEPLLAFVEEKRITHMHLVPTMMVRLLRLPVAIRDRYDVSSLQCVTHGAAPCPPQVKQQMIEWWGPKLREYYGSTEGSLASAVSSKDWLERPGTVGRALPGAVIEIQDDNGSVLGANQTGEIYFRLAQAPPFEYQNLPDARAAIERGALMTNGDVGHLDDAGFLFISDRKRDMVISGGVNIYPAEIESALFAHPQVRDCAAFGIPDDEFGERLAIVVEREPGARIDANDVRAFLTERLAAFKVPKLIDFRETLPRQDNGKIYKAGLRAPYWKESGRHI